MSSCAFECFLLRRRELVKHLEDTERVLYCVSVKVIVEVAVGDFDRTFDFFHLGQPICQFVLGVMIVVPGSLATAVPPDVSEVGSHMHLWRQKWLVHDCVRNVVLGKSPPGLVSEPGFVTKFYGVLETVWSSERNSSRCAESYLYFGGS